MMKLAAGLLGIAHDLVIGDCWPLAALVAGMLATGLALLHLGVPPAAWLDVALAAVVMLGAGVTVYVEARARLARTAD